ncbi:MAG: Replication factor C subunit 1 [Bathelium mastoideum]|nr:MAG: Replication factor C subunit 1 [Bathelium mastoideum]
MPKSPVYIVTREDFENQADELGTFSLISAHASLASANSAAEAHLNSERTEGGPAAVAEVDEIYATNGCYQGTAVVAAWQRHHFSIVVRKLNLEGGLIAVSDEPKAAGKNKGAKKASTSSKKRKEQVASDHEQEDDDEEVVEEEKKPSKSTKAPSKKQKSDARKPEVAEGSPDCLDGLQFVISGTLDGFTRDQAKALVVNRGGKTLSSISSKVDYVILGANPGAKKLEQIEELELQTLDLDGFNNLIREKAGQ